MDLSSSDATRLFARARLQELENVPSFSKLVQRYELFCSSVKSNNFKDEIEKLDAFSDLFFEQNKITDQTLQNQISFKAFCAACSKLSDNKK